MEKIMGSNRFSRYKKYNQGGYLEGPSHEQGGIPAIVGGTTPIELEGGEYIINAQTVNALGTDFLDKVNSTATTYHTGGYGQGQLPSPSVYKKGGRTCPVGQHWMPPTDIRAGFCMDNSAHLNNNGKRMGTSQMRIRVRKGPQIAMDGNKKACPEGMYYDKDGFCI